MTLTSLGFNQGDWLSYKGLVRALRRLAPSAKSLNLCYKFPMTEEQLRSLAMLDHHHQWPSMYSFKFIVPAVKGKELEQLIPEAEQFETRPSSGGKYTAYTFHCPMGSGREVLSVYARVKSIPGVLAL